MRTIESLYGLFSVTLSVAGLSMVAFAVRAYRQTGRRTLFHLSIGFTFVVAAAIATTVSAFVYDFEGVRFLLSVNYLLSTIDFLFIIFLICQIGEFEHEFVFPNSIFRPDHSYRLYIWYHT